MSTQRQIVIGLVAGEVSGDILGAGLMRAIKERLTNVRFVGVPGPEMLAEGCEPWFDMEELAVMGLVEVIKHLPRLLRIHRILKQRFAKLKPDVFVGIDAPDTNLRIESYLKQHGIKTVHYVSPSIWAWRQNRVHTIAKATNMVLAFLPFEKAFYDRFNVPCRFVGHTMADAIPLIPDRAMARRTLGINEQALCLALLPGSRKAEITMLTPSFLQTAVILRQHYPELEIVVPMVNKRSRQLFEQIKQQQAPNLKLRLLDGQARLAMMASDAAILASGTVALECMLAKCPMVVAYKMHALTFWLAKRLVKIDYVSLPNLLAGREIVHELLQDECQPAKLATAILPLFKDNSERQTLLHIFTELHKSIRCHADEQAAKAVLEFVDY